MALRCLEVKIMFMFFEVTDESTIKSDFNVPYTLNYLNKHVVFSLNA